jgi:hypothetical protein
MNSNRRNILSRTNDLVYKVGVQRDVATSVANIVKLENMGWNDF